MLPLHSSWKKLAFIVVFAFSALTYRALIWAAEPATLLTQDAQKVPLVVGKSAILKSDKPVKRVSVAKPEVADIFVVSPNEIYITGKSAGITNMTLWQDKGIYAIYDLDVAYDTVRLKQKLHEVLPQETDLRVVSTNDSIALSGKISNAANLSQALAIAKAFAPEGKLQNLMEVGGVQQVMLEVRISEMQRSVIKRLGINFGYSSPSGNFGISRLGGLSGSAAPSLVDQISPAVNAIFRFNMFGATWTTLIDALKEDGLVKILAEPNLIALSGQEANFLAGGEFPVPVPQPGSGGNAVTIEYKSFGVSLIFTPTVLSGNKINVRVAPEVSELDFTNAVQFSGFVVPGLTTRKAETTIELADGQSFAIAGLLRDTTRQSVSKYPVLGEIPVLGALFRSSSFQKSESELVIVVTPHLVKPLNMANQSLPTDYYVEPSDAEFYLLGLMEGRGKDASRTGGGLDGEFGHAMPK